MLVKLICLWIAIAATMLGQTPAVTDNGVVNLANSAPGQAVAPGSLVAIFGTQLASQIATADTIPLSTSRADVMSVTFNGISAPIVAVSPNQITAQVPWEVGPGSAMVMVNRNTGSSNPVAVQVAAVAPAIFSFSFAGRQAIALNNADGSLAAPANLLPGMNSHPAAAGDTLVVYATGLGAVTPDPVTGNNSADTTRTTVATPNVLVGGVSAQVSFSGLSPQLVGMYQLNIVVPQGVQPGSAVPLQIQMGDTPSTDQVTIAVQ